MNAARIAALMVEGYGPNSALLMATQRRTAWAAALEAAPTLEKVKRAAARVTFWRTIAKRIESQYAGVVQ